MPRNVVRPRRPHTPAQPAGATAARPELSLTHPAHLAALAVAAACVALIVLTLIQDPDLWQHLAVGRAIWTTHEIPHTQVWTWPTYGSPDVNSSWGFEFLLWPFWRAAGATGLNAWRVLSAWLAFGLAWAIARRMGARDLAPLVVCVLGALVAHRRLQLRPETWALILMALNLLVLEARRHGAPRHAVLWLIPIAWAWANSHISWPFGFANILIHLAADLFPGHPRRGDVGLLTATALGALAVSFVNPFGAGALTQPFDFLTHQRQSTIFLNIPELQPLDWGRNLRTGLPLFVFGWPLLAAWRARRRGLDRVELATMLVYTLLALRAQRFVTFYALAATAYVARDFAEWLASLAPPAWAGRPWRRATFAGAACAGLALLRWTDPHDPFDVRVDPRVVPSGASEFVAAHSVRGRVFNHFWLGGYLLHRFWPERDRLPFMDIHQAGGPELQAAYIDALRSPNAWRALREHWSIEWTLLSRENMPGDHIVETLDADSTFRLVYLDDVAAVYVRHNGTNAGVADSFGYRVLRSSPARFGPLMQASMTDSTLRRALHGELARAADGAGLNTWATRWRDATAGASGSGTPPLR